MWLWYETKAWFSEFIGIGSDQLHVHVGLAVFLVALYVLRRRRGAVWLAWLTVLAVQGVNEALDAVDWINWTGRVNWPETARDFATTLFWPTVLVLFLRRGGFVRGR